MAKENVNFIEIAKKILQQRRSVGLLQFEFKTENNFAKWYSLTENLVIKAFGQKSNQLKQLQDLYRDMKYRSNGEHYGSLKAGEAKEKLKNLLTVFAEELNMDTGLEKHFSRVQRGSTKNVLIANQTITTSISINQIIESIKGSEPNEEKAKEAEVKLKELEVELKQTSPAWAKIKGVLEWLMNFSRDAFLAVLPIIIEHYRKQ